MIPFFLSESSWWTTAFLIWTVSSTMAFRKNRLLICTFWIRALYLVNKAKSRVLGNTHSQPELLPCGSDVRLTDHALGSSFQFLGIALSRSQQPCHGKCLRKAPRSFFLPKLFFSFSSHSSPENLNTCILRLQHPLSTAFDSALTLDGLYVHIRPCSRLCRGPRRRSVSHQCKPSTKA